MAYSRTVWVNDSLPAINAENLNKIENQLEQNTNDIANIIESGSNNNGYWIKFSEGTLIQYGSTSYEPSESFKQVYFPIAFRDVSYYFSVIGNYNYYVNVCFAISSILKDRINVYPQRGDGTAVNQTQPFLWFAIGKWK